MKVINLTHSDEEINKEPHVLAIGFFDGVHLGHQQLLQRAKRLARKQGWLFSVMTFDPHPDEVIKGDSNRKYLMPLPQKIIKMKEFGADQLFIMNFDRAFAQLLPAEFIRKYIQESNTKHVVVGFDFTFGFKAKGNTELLAKESKEYGFGLSVIPKKTYHEQKISSTRIRDLVKKGKMEIIPYYLGENYKICATVSRTVTGWYTVRSSARVLLPAPGVYLVEIKQADRVIQAKYIQYSDQVGDNELITEKNLILDDHCTITFLSKVKEAQMLFV